MIDGKTCNVADLIDITYNIDENLPSDWTTIYVIMHQIKTINSRKKLFSCLTVYAWNDNVTHQHVGHSILAYKNNKNLGLKWLQKYQTIIYL